MVPPSRYLQNWTIIVSIFAVLIPLSQCFDYGEALVKSLLYYESQRSGRLPYNQRLSWRHHSGLTDGLEQGVDLVGGYYDAGDNVKFGLPMAFTVTMLSWGVIEYGEQIAAAGEYGHALEGIKWGTDYFIKAHTHPNVLWAQVGDGDTDHYCWQRPEDMTTSRQAYKIDENNPGSDLAGETAAAMAAASIVFRTTNPHYSHLLLHHSQQLFEFGDKFRGNYDESVKVAKGYYSSVSGYMDELLWAALWLYKATDKDEYLEYVIEKAHSFGGITWAITEFSWDVKYAGVQLIASMAPKNGALNDWCPLFRWTSYVQGVGHTEMESTDNRCSPFRCTFSVHQDLLLTNFKIGLLMKKERHREQNPILQQYRSKAEHYICACLNKNNFTNVHRTPGGLMYIRQWNNMQYVSTSSFLLTVYSDYLHSTNQIITCDGGLVGPQDLLSFAKSQVDYILGSNPMGLSYLVGYGFDYPKRVHHRGASIESYKESKGFIGCTQGYDNWYGKQDSNPNVLVGALVGGPDYKDVFRDDRGNYMQTEACTYNSAPLVGIFAKLYGLQGSSNKSTSTLSLIFSS